MRWIGTLTKLWAWFSFILVTMIILFLFGYVFDRGVGSISVEFLTQSPKGMVLGAEGGIWPAIVGSLYFTGAAVVLGSIPAIAVALYQVFYCKSKKMASFIRLVMECISGLPSIVLGLFSYTVLVRDLGLGRCILAASAALAIMILPFIEVRAEKAFREIPDLVIQSAYALGCSKAYTIAKVVLPASRGELISGMILGGCYAMGATAPVMFTGAVAYAAVPHSLLSPAMSLPLHLYLLLSQGATSMPAVYGTAFVMMVLILAGNMTAAIYAEHCRKKWSA